MPSKNDLSALKAKPAKVLEVAASNPEKKVQPLPKKAGRKAKPVGEKESATLALKITELELEALKEKAGLVPLATFVKSYLREKTDLLD